MLKEIIQKENLMQEAKELQRRRKFSPGIDGMSAKGAASWIAVNGEKFCRDVFNGDYSPMPALRFVRAKSGGGYRNLAKLCALDTILQNVLKKELTVGVEESFSDNSFAYRPGRGVHSALERYTELADKYKYTAKLDFVSCFENINHEKLSDILNESLKDKKLHELIMKFVKMPIASDGEVENCEKGLLQGMPLAPMLCNIYLDCADRYLDEKNIRFIRYADDIVLFGETYDEAKEYLKIAEGFFEEKLFLKCNTRKKAILPAADMKFLGHTFSNSRKGKLEIDASSDDAEYYCSWKRENPSNNRRRINLLSDGILRLKDFSFMFDTDAQDTVIPPASTEVINVYSNVIFDSGFFKMAARNGITVNIFDQTNKRIGTFIPEGNLKSPATTHEQLLAYYDETHRLQIAKEFLLASIHNSLLNIRYYNKQDEKAEYSEAIKRLTAVKKEIKNETNYEKMLLAEARARQIYYDCYDMFIKKENFVFEKRTRKPPENKFNALLSFGNAVLYNFIATEIQKTALDIRVGFLHATNTRKQSLNLDIAEIFKPLLVDRTILSLVNKGVLTDSDFSVSENGVVSLSPNAKKAFINAFSNKLETHLNIKNESVSYREIIIREIRMLIRHFRNGEKYKAFRQVR